MDKKDAKLFSDFFQFCLFIGEVTPLIMDVENAIFNKEGINFSSLQHLNAIGLISFESLSGYKKQGFGKFAQIFYFGIPTLIEFSKDSDNEIQIGQALLTQAGQELAPICGAQRNDAFYKYVIGKWHKRGLVLSTPLPKKSQ